MSEYQTAFVVTAKTGNEFTVKQKGHLGVLVIETFKTWYDVPVNVIRDEFSALQELCLALLNLGVPREVLLPVYISVLVMVGFEVHSIDVKE